MQKLFDLPYSKCILFTSEAYKNYLTFKSRTKVILSISVCYLLNEPIFFKNMHFKYIKLIGTRNCEIQCYTFTIKILTLTDILVFTMNTLEQRQKILV